MKTKPDPQTQILVTNGQAVVRDYPSSLEIVEKDAKGWFEVMEAERRAQAVKTKTCAIL